MKRILSVIALALAATPAAAGDPGRGAELYERRCSACHSLDADRVGPRHRGVFGRAAGSLPDFAYSAALRRSGIVWDDATLERWLANPQALVPGQRMGFRLNDANERADIIAYLRRESGR